MFTATKVCPVFLSPSYLSIVFIMFLVACAGCNSSVTGKSNAAYPMTDGLTALELIRQAGDIVRDAETYEASGREYTKDWWLTTSSNPVKWVFGPMDAYRFEYLGHIIVFDARYLHWRKSERPDPFIIVDSWADSEENAQYFPTETTPDRRNLEGLGMASGMIAGGRTLPTIGMRLDGGHFFLSSFSDEDVIFSIKGEERIFDRPCLKIVVFTGEKSTYAEFWIDRETGVLRQFEERRRPDSTKRGGFSYPHVRVNSGLDASLLHIPEELMREAVKDVD
jgi:hypothetical protein